MEPELKIVHLAIWVDGRQFPDASDFWDGNWLIVRAEWREPNAFVRAEGPILHLSEVARFVRDCEKLYESLKGSAELDCIEPNMRVRLTAESLGHIKAEVDLTPDHMAQRHTFIEEIDQSYLPSIIQAAKGILSTYPMKEPENFVDGV